MRITDDRYHQQRFRLEVAMRMIAHRARSGTIRQSTDISEDRIRKLHRSYFAFAGADRKRGKSPQTLESLTHNLKVRTDANVFASVLHATGLLRALREKRAERLDVQDAARICDVYELFLQVRPTSDPDNFSFEHAWYLVRLLLLNDELTTNSCPHCNGMMLVDVYGPKRSQCSICEFRNHSRPRKASKR